MRMWMVAPITMCQQHLNGEHLELHMFLGTLRKSKKVQGYIKNNLLEIKSLQKRHAAIVYEMQRRMKLDGKHSGHTSQLTKAMVEVVVCEYEDIIEVEINRVESGKALFDRCPVCQARKEKAVRLEINPLNAFFRCSSQKGIKF